MSVVNGKLYLDKLWMLFMTKSTPKVKVEGIFSTADYVQCDQTY